MANDEVDRLRTQLAACGVAALDGSKSQEAEPYSYGWSPAYADVLKLRREHNRVVRELQETGDHWLNMAKDRRDMAATSALRDERHAKLIAQAEMLESCAYALTLVLDGENEPERKESNERE